MSISDPFDGIMTKKRQEIIEIIGLSPYIQIFPVEKQGKYLVGVAQHATSNRAVCLAWGNEVEGRITMDILEDACREIAEASLNAPFLFFCRTCFVVSPDLFACMQIPYVFDYQEILPTLRTMNLRGRPRPITFVSD